MYLCTLNLLISSTVHAFLSVVCCAGPVPDSPEKSMGASPTASPVPGSPSLTDNKEGSKKNKDSSPVGSKKASIFSSIGHKLTKSKPKLVPGGTLSVPIVDVTTSGSVEDGFVLVAHSSKLESNSGKFRRLHVATRRAANLESKIILNFLSRLKCDP